MPYGCVEVVVKLKAPPQRLFDGHEFNDRIVMRLQPSPHLDIRIDIKSPGLNDEVETATLTHAYPQDRAIDGYEKLLYDVINNDQSHFVHAEEVMESWRIVMIFFALEIIVKLELCPTSTLVVGDHHISYIN